MPEFGRLAEAFLKEHMECKMIWEDQDTWNELVAEAGVAQIQYKAFNLKFQEMVCRGRNESYKDISVVLYRGGHAVGVWPLCIWREEGHIYCGSAGDAPRGGIIPPLLTRMSKAEAKRKVYDKCITVLSSFLKESGGTKLRFCETVMESGVSLWHRKLMENGAKCVCVTHHLYTDLALSMDEILGKIRRTNKYSISMEQQDYSIELYEKGDENISEAMQAFRKMHIEVAGRETRSIETWNMQEESIRNSTDCTGYSFLILIRDRQTDQLAGSALFDATPSCAYYCAAVYDRSRFSKPVGHIVQAVAMKRLKEYGVRWYEVGERTYASDEDANEKLMNIGHYKEGFATHCFPRIYTELKL